MKAAGFSPRAWLVMGVLGVAGLLALRSALAPPGGAVMVFAASSLSDLLQEVARNFRDHTGGVVEYDFHSSALLKRKIDAGGRPDLFISASPVEVDALEKEGLVMARADLMKNRLVLLEKLSRPGWEERLRAGEELLRRPGTGRIALGDPGHVPAGRYGREALERLGLWGEVEGRLVRTIHVRQVLEYVKRGEADLGIAYRTDARAVEGVRVLWVFPEETHSAIVYVGASIQGGEHPRRAAEFLEYLKSRARRTVIERHGFLVPR